MYLFLKILSTLSWMLGSIMDVWCLAQEFTIKFLNKL